MLSNKSAMHFPPFDSYILTLKSPEEQKKYESWKDHIRCQTTYSVYTLQQTSYFPLRMTIEDGIYLLQSCNAIFGESWFLITTSVNCHEQPSGVSLGNWNGNLNKIKLAVAKTCNISDKENYGCYNIEKW